MGVDVEALLAARPGGRAELRRTTTPASNNSGLWLGWRSASWRSHGRDKRRSSSSEPIGELRPLGRAADRRVDRQAGQGHPAGRRRAARRARRLRRRPRVRLPAQRGRARRGLRRAGRGARQGGPPDADAGGARRRRPRPHLLLRRVRDRRRGLGARASTRSTSPTCRRPRTTPTRCSTGRRAARRSDADDDAAGAARAGRAAALRGDHGLRAAVGGVRRGDRRAARAIRDAHEGDHDVRLRPALPALDRPVPQGRAGDRRCSSSSCTTATRTSRSPRPATRSARSRTPRRPATCRRCAPTACRPSGYGSKAIRPPPCERWPIKEMI